MTLVKATWVRQGRAWALRPEAPVKPGDRILAVRRDGSTSEVTVASVYFGLATPARETDE